MERGNRPCSPAFTMPLTRRAKSKGRPSSGSSAPLVGRCTSPISPTSKEELCTNWRRQTTAHESQRTYSMHVNAMAQLYAGHGLVDNHTPRTKKSPPPWWKGPRTRKVVSPTSQWAQEFVFENALMNAHEQRQQAKGRARDNGATPLASGKASPYASPQRRPRSAPSRRGNSSGPRRGGPTPFSFRNTVDCADGESSREVSPAQPPPLLERDELELGGFEAKLDFDARDALALAADMRSASGQVPTAAPPHRSSGSILPSSGTAPVILCPSAATGAGSEHQPRALTRQQVDLCEAFSEMLVDFDPHSRLALVKGVLHDAQRRTLLENYQPKG